MKEEVKDNVDQSEKLEDQHEGRGKRDLERVAGKALGDHISRMFGRDEKRHLEFVLVGGLAAVP